MVAFDSFGWTCAHFICGFTDFWLGKRLEGKRFDAVDCVARASLIILKIMYIGLLKPEQV